MVGIETLTEPATGAGALSVTFAPNKEFVFKEMRLHLGVASATTENLVITIQSNKGSTYNTKIYSRDMNSVQDLVYQPSKEHPLIAGDSLKIEWTNTNLRTWGLEIIYKG